MKKILLALACVGALACSSATDSTQGPEDPGILHTRDTRSTTSQGPLLDNGGPVLPASNTYAIWWGNSAAWPSDTKAGIDSLFTGLNGTSFLGIGTQYMRGASVTSSFHTNWTDTSTPPRGAPNTSAIVSEACRAIAVNGAKPDPNGIYFVYTSNFPHSNYCAWHSHGTCNGVDIKVAYMPNTTGVAGCDLLDVVNLGCNTLSEGTQSLANVTSHEFMETITDPDLSAWYDSSGAEIGDKCAWTFSSCVTLSNSTWQLQQEWSNATSSCVQQ